VPILKNKPSIVVFSDVDYVLRNPVSPLFATAAGILKQLSHNEAIVLCSGRTRAEIEFVQQKLDIAQPFICENGGAALIPEGYFDFDVPNAWNTAGYQVVKFGRNYTEIVQILHRTAERLRIGVVGFSDMSIEEVARECHLPLLQARLAKLREYDEPFRIVDANPAARGRLIKALQAASLRCTTGDVFDRAGGPTEIALGVDLLRGIYRRACGAVTTIGVTRAEPRDNLLRLVDHTIMVPEACNGDAANIVDWAEAIVDRVKEVRKRQAVAVPPLTA
jgi:mannosyl-3-phosphoglycerate phosphatase